MKVHLGSDFPRAVHLLLLGESGDGGPAQRGQLGEHLGDNSKSKLYTGEMNIMHKHMVVWMNTAGATGKVTRAQVSRKFQEEKAQQAEVIRSAKICPEEGALRHQGQRIGDAGVV